jgi:ABC-2 type transport system ATP-binding protein
VADGLLRADSVTKRFDTIEAVSNLSVELAPGTIGLVGPDGSGETTLLRLLLDVLPPTSGGLSVAAQPGAHALRLRSLA